MKLIQALVFTALLPAAAHAVIVYGPQTRNTTVPTGSFPNSGWQYEGNWGSFLGTPIAPHAFITAKHVEGSVGNTFSYLSTNYTTTSFSDNPGTDLRVWQVSGTFPSYAPLYTASNETNKELVVFGRGTQRGTVFNVGGQAQGWLWGPIDGVQSWGTNTVDGIATDPSLGQFLQYDFAANPGVAGVNEGILSDHDSGGGVFINDAGTWKLAGINYGTDGPYKFDPNATTSFHASLYDQSGLYVENASHQWVAAPNSPGASYSSRISSNATWISTAVPEPASMMFVGAAGFMLGRRRQSRAQ